jgi:hypothetical protein
MDEKPGVSGREEEETWGDAEEGHGSDDGDTTAAQAHAGRDLQGIRWERHRSTRERYRQSRLEQYDQQHQPYQQGGAPRRVVGDVVEKGARFYDFQLNTRKVPLPPYNPHPSVVGEHY